MRSIFRMPSDELAGDAQHRVPILKNGGRQMRSIFRMPSDELAGDAQRRVPILKRGRKKANERNGGTL